jgi:hypothetical protein
LSRQHHDFPAYQPGDDRQIVSDAMIGFSYRRGSRDDFIIKYLVDAIAWHDRALTCQPALSTKY